MKGMVIQYDSNHKGRKEFNQRKVPECSRCENDEAEVQTSSLLH